MNGIYHGSQFDFYLKERILESFDSDSRKNIMSTTIDFIRNLFRIPAAVVTGSSSGGDLWSLYQLSRGRDSVSPAVLRKLADAAAK